MTKVKPNISPIGMARYAREYYDAALGADEKIGDRPGYEIIARPPVMFLVAHSIELSLKAFLLKNGETSDSLRSYGHDIEKCWRKANSLGLASISSLSTEEQSTLELVSSLHKSTELRYIQTGYRRFPVFGALQNLAIKLLDSICPFVGYK